MNNGYFNYYNLSIITLDDLKKFVNQSEHIISIIIMGPDCQISYKMLLNWKKKITEMNLNNIKVEFIHLRYSPEIEMYFYWQGVKQHAIILTFIKNNENKLTPKFIVEEYNNSKINLLFEKSIQLAINI